MRRPPDARRVVVILATAALACGTAQSQTHGSATYAKPANQGGQPVPQQNQSDLKVTVSVTGSGTFAPVQSAACTLTQGDLTESSASSGHVNSDGSYVSTFDTQSTSASGQSWTNPLCGAVQNVKLTSLTSLTVQSSIPTSDSNCQGYCSATASAQCQGSVDPNCSSTATASCTTQCKGAQRITGHGSLQQSDMADANSKLGSSQGQVDAKVDMVFDALQ